MGEFVLTANLPDDSDLVVGLVSIALPSMECLFVLWATFLADKLYLPPFMEAFTYLCLYHCHEQLVSKVGILEFVIVLLLVCLVASLV